MTFRDHFASGRGLAIELVKNVLVAYRDRLSVTALELAAFVVVSAVEGAGANAASDMFDERLASELTPLVTLYLTGAEATLQPVG